MKYIQNKNISQRVMENEVMIVLPREINKNITIINQFVYMVMPTSDITFDWYINLSDTADIRATYSVEGRKKKHIIKLEEIEEISSLHRAEYDSMEEFVKSPHVSSYLHRQLSRAKINRNKTLNRSEKSERFLRGLT